MNLTLLIISLSTPAYADTLGGLFVDMVRKAMETPKDNLELNKNQSASLPEQLKVPNQTFTQGEAEIEEAITAYDKGDYDAAWREIQPLAEQENVAAQNLLGVMYHNGEGVPQDHAQASEWYRKAAEQGYAAAQKNLGVLYDNGEGVPQNYAQASMWYRKAAEQGYAAAQNNLGILYHNGDGVPQDYAQASVWYRKAAEQGYANAQNNLGVLYGIGKGVSQDYAQALVWYRKAADQGNMRAQLHLGNMYANGQGVLQDYSQAVTWYRKAADQGSSDAQKNLRTLEDEARGYKQISFTDFQLDAKKMKLGRKLSITGFYKVTDEIETLAETSVAAMMPNTHRLFLLTEDAPRVTRKKLLEARNGICGYYGCPLTVLGHVSKCEVTWFGNRVKSTTCLSVDDIRSK